MKRPINISKMLTLGSFSSIVVLLLGINLMKNTSNVRTYGDVPEGGFLLKLDDKTIRRSEKLQPFTSLSLNVKFIDSLFFIPSTTPRVEISGDKALVNNLLIYCDDRVEVLSLRSKFHYQVKESEQSTKGFSYSLKKGGLVVKIYYRELQQLIVNQHVKVIVHKGVFRADRLFIYASANTAQFNVEAKHLQLHLEKPTLFQSAKPLANNRHEYNDELIQYVNQPLRVVGKADLVEATHNAGSILDLTQLQCRHVHADYANAKYSVLEVAPTQLFSYIIRREDEQHHSEMICKSKALVTKAHFIPELGLVERFR